MNKHVSENTCILDVSIMGAKHHLYTLESGRGCFGMGNWL